MTWAEIIETAGRRARLVGRGLPITSDIFDEGLTVLKTVINQLDGEGYAIPGMSTEITFTTVGGQSKYLLGPGGDADTRPLTIISMQFLLATNVWQTSRYEKIVVKNNQGPPYGYALNPTFPKSEIYFYLQPNQAYPVKLLAKIPMEDSVGDPACNLCDTPEYVPGFENAMIDLVALQWAEQNDKEKPALYNRASMARQFIMVNLKQQTPDLVSDSVSGQWPWNTNTSGVNP